MRLNPYKKKYKKKPGLLPILPDAETVSYDQFGRS